MNRRNFICASAAATLAMSASAKSVGTTPTRADLERYYAFLWCELGALSKEMGVQMLDYWSLHSGGGHKAYLTRHGHEAPSARAGRVLKALGASVHG